MADEDYDPNANVSDLVNILVPIGSAVAFIVVVVALYRTRRECRVEVLEDVVERIPFLGRSQTDKTIIEPTDQKQAEHKTITGQTNIAFVVDTKTDNKGLHTTIANEQNHPATNAIPERPNAYDVHPPAYHYSTYL